MTESSAATLPTSRHRLGRAYSTDNATLSTSIFGTSYDGGATRLANHLDSIFSPLKFPPELANRVLTHSSHRDAAASNNARLSFIGTLPMDPYAPPTYIYITGRRVLNSYLMLFLHSAPSLQTTHEYELIAERALNTYVLGEHVAPKWELGRVLKWSPVKADPEVDNAEGDFSKLSTKVSRTVGLYKVQGSAVEAVVGGIYHQFVSPLTAPHIYCILIVLFRRPRVVILHIESFTLVFCLTFFYQACQWDSTTLSTSMLWKSVNGWAGLKVL